MYVISYMYIIFCVCVFKHKSPVKLNLTIQQILPHLKAMTYTSVWTCPWRSRWEEPVADVRGTRLVSQPVSLSVIQHEPDPPPPWLFGWFSDDFGVKFNSQDVCCQWNFSSLQGEHGRVIWLMVFRNFCTSLRLQISNYWPGEGFLQYQQYHSIT